MDFAGHPLRAERPFQLLVETPAGEQMLEADAVMDASGTYGHPNPIGSGTPAIGERAVAKHLIRDLGALDQRLEGLAEKRVVLVGHGHSAANAIVLLQELATRAPRTHVTWAVRSLNLRPCTEVACDPLPERQRVVAEANLLAARPPAWLKMEGNATVETIGYGNGALHVSFSRNRNVKTDAVVALTGYRPDFTFLSELAIEIAPSTDGAGRLAAALANVTDCLSGPVLRAEDLDSGEPGFHLAGAKSYGRSRTFLLQSGYRQVDSILNRLDLLT